MIADYASWLSGQEAPTICAELARTERTLSSVSVAPDMRPDERAAVLGVQRQKLEVQRRALGRHAQAQEVPGKTEAELLSAGPNSVTVESLSAWDGQSPPQTYRKAQPLAGRASVMLIDTRGRVITGAQRGKCVSEVVSGALRAAQVGEALTFRTSAPRRAWWLFGRTVRRFEVLSQM